MIIILYYAECMEVQILWIRLVSIALNTFTGRMAPHQFLVGSWLWHQPGNCQRTQEHWSRPSHHPLLPREAVNLWHLSDTEQASLSPTVWQACRLWGRVFCLHDVFFFFISLSPSLPPTSAFSVSRGAPLLLPLFKRSLQSAVVPVVKHF